MINKDYTATPSKSKLLKSGGKKAKKSKLVEGLTNINTRYTTRNRSPTEPRMEIAEENVQKPKVNFDNQFEQKS